MMMWFYSFVLSLFAASPSLAIDISSDSFLGKELLSKARRLDDNGDYDFVSSYSLKFQGCHHVQQWNDEADGEDDVRIKTKRLARFRLCPSDQCSNERSAGCNSKFGDYVVDMSTFVYSYLQAIENEKDNICEEVVEDCQNLCNNGANDDDGSCMDSCYDAYDVSFCSQNYNENDDFDPADYAECQQYNFGGRRRRLDDGNQNDQYNYYQNYQYYIGAYCADQGGEIHIGLFTDDTCTTFAQNGESLFYNKMGFELPYSDNSLITSRCIACGASNQNGYYESKEICEDIYKLSGKCETRMSVDYPNESSCSYIEGIKIVREDGVIRTSTTKKSKAAAVAIGLFMTFAVLLAGYVYYLRTKLGRAQINLAAASQPLT